MSDVYYPSLVCDLRVRFDESFQEVVKMSEPVSVESLSLAGILAGQRPSSGIVTQPLIRAEQASLAGILAGQRPADQLSVIMGRIPKSASVELSGYRQAGKFTATFDFRDLPIDPRLVRACDVEVHMGVVPASAFGRGMTRLEQDNTRASIIRTDNQNEISQNTLMMAGLVDGWTIEHGESGSEVTLEGRDHRGVFLDSPVDPKMVAGLDARRPIGLLVQDILDKHPFGARFKGLVNINPLDWPNGIVPSPASVGEGTRLRRGVSGTKSQLQPPGDKYSFWDLITYCCFRVGAIPHFQGYRIFIRPARTSFDTTRIAGVDRTYKPPFKDGLPREVPDGQFPERKERLYNRRLVYGRDVRRLNFERKYTGKKAATVECVSVDVDNPVKGRNPVTGEPNHLVTGRWPKKPDPSSARNPSRNAQRTSVSADGKQSSEEVLRITVAGYRDRGKLTEIAKNIYEEIGRGEMGGSCETRSLASFGGDNSDPDLLRLRPGDPVEFMTDTKALGGGTSSSFPLVAALIDSERRSPEEQVKEVAERLGDENLARIIVATARKAVKELQRPWRVATVKYGWDKDSGVAISFDFQNYIEARADAGGS